MHRGYVKIFRKMFDNPMWTCEKFSRGQAWIDLILLTNYRDGEIRVRGITVPVLRGFCGWSQLSLSARWKWSRGKLQRFLDDLETRQQIVQQKTRVTTLIKIVNYDEYQEIVQQNKQQTDNKQDTNNKDKKDNIKNSGSDEPLSDCCPQNEIVDAYRRILPELVQPKVWDGVRASNLRSIWKSAYESNNGLKSNSVEYWERLFEHVRSSSFLMGSVSNGKPPFKCSLDWIVKKANFLKIIEGKYHR